jgi:hypothetical protein
MSAKSWRDLIKVHEACEAFPPVSAEESREIGSDIRNHSLYERVAMLRDLDTGKLALLDGKTRLDAIEREGFILTVDDEGGPLADFGNGPESIYRVVETDDPVAFVKSANLHRRHMTGAQKRKAIDDLLKAHPEKTDRQIAREAKVSHPTVAKVRREMGDEPNGNFFHTNDNRQEATGRKARGRKAMSLKQWQRKTAKADVEDPEVEEPDVFDSVDRRINDLASVMGKVRNLLSEEERRQIVAKLTQLIAMYEPSEADRLGPEADVLR